MSEPYYRDDLVTLYHGDSLEILPTLNIEANVLLTDPPYFKVKRDAWDNQWGKADEFLAWMGEWLDLTKPLLAANASAWVFASPAMASSVERVVGERFRVLNSIRWAKLGGDNLRRTSLPALRSFVSIWEGIMFAEQFSESARAASLAESKGAWAGIGATLEHLRVASGATRDQVAAAMAGESGSFAGAKARVSAWEIGNERISRRGYEALLRYCGESIEPFERLADKYDASLEQSRRPFTVVDRKLAEDIWFFHSVAKYPGKHPCEKPAPLLSHMIEVSSKPGHLIIDPFAGSGSTLEAARNLGRRAVGIEQDERWCEHAALRLSEYTLDLEGAA